jgi:DNA polymerase I-like protein with 3'-5' exonuclease and polymerase domains
VKSGAKRRNYHIGGEQLPLITPESNWEPPTELPDLRRVPLLAMDTEERDESLIRKRGSGWPYKAGYIAGMSIAWEGGAFYAPVRHPETACLDYDAVGRWLADHIAAGCRFITHHGSHDWGWICAQWGIPFPPGLQLDDTEAMAMTVDENRLSYSLENLCVWRNVRGKDEVALREAANAYGIDPKADLWRLPARYVGPYAEQDARALLPLAESLLATIRSEETEAAYRLEMDLMPTVLAMRKRGIRINVERARQAKIDIIQQRDAVLMELAGNLGCRVSIEDCRSNRKLVPWFEEQKINFPYTEKGAPSFSAQWMRKHTHWLPRLVARAEQLTEAADKFVQGFILDYAHQGRLHAHINQYRGEEGGTRSFRFSYADPPLQQMPARDGELAPLIRGFFEPEPGEEWAAPDYSQQEYRLIVSYSKKIGEAQRHKSDWHAMVADKATEAAQRYINDPDTDFHVLVADWTGLDRKPAKDTNFAKAFGAGVPKFATMINKLREEAQQIYDLYDNELPFVKESSEFCKRLADNRGYMVLLDGARSHFDMWEPAWYDKGEGWVAPGPLDYAKAKWPNRRLRRSHTHKAFNRLIQGSAARMMKLAIRDCAREGLIPLIQMHDELGFSVSSREQVVRIVELMVNCVKLEVPVKVDAEVGPTWGGVK